MLPEGVDARQPLDLVGLEEAEAPSLPFVFLPDVLHLVSKRQQLQLSLLESVLTKLPDLAARAAEDLAEGGVAHEGGALAVGDHAAVLELEDVVDLLFRVLLHL